ncbi:hypothetical protein [Achromobacter insuavis]|uniref:hypothetical protein n=1 Tax=Achromobacter insuavis TaxID=1287735 RepID=UPI001F12BB01|nr:hypothetical protein [Achromobacter insuavis]
MKAERVNIKTVRTLKTPLLGVSADVLGAFTQAKLDALKAQRNAPAKVTAARPAERKKAHAVF